MCVLEREQRESEISKLEDNLKAITEKMSSESADYERKIS